jgi:subfamily B ATP-binding cassette protein MsbA
MAQSAPPEKPAPPPPPVRGGADAGHGATAEAAAMQATDRAADRARAGWLWRGYLRPQRWAMAGALVLMALEGSMLGALALLIQPMFDEILVARRGDLVWLVAGGVAATFVLRAAASLVHRTVMAHLAESAVAQIQADLVRHLMRLDRGFHQHHPPGVLIERVRGDAAPIAQLQLALIPALGRDGVAVLALLGAALWTDWRWTLLALVGVPLLIVPIRGLQRLVRRVGADARASSAVASNRLDEIFHGIDTVQLSGLEQREAGRLEHALAAVRRAQVRAVFGSAGMSSLADVVAALGFAFVLAYGAGQIIGGTRSVGEFMAFFTAFALLFDPLRRISALSGAWATVMASVERVKRLMDEVPRITTPDKPRKAGAAARLCLEGVEFGYGRAPVLRGVNLVAEAGQTTALVGPSGAGKSTIFTLIARLADPQGGRVTLGGVDLRALDLGALRAMISVVAQDAALFDETLRDNITLNTPGVSEARLRAAIEAAHVDAFLGDLPQGLETRVGPRGSALSGGQRQRVAIARAILRDTPVLLLDEATSALDARSEQLVQGALERLGAGRTTLVIAHRLATVRRADKIVVMEAGQVAEEGNHETLLARGGSYARLHALQFGNDATGR